MRGAVYFIILPIGRQKPKQKKEQTILLNRKYASSRSFYEPLKHQPYSQKQHSLNQPNPARTHATFTPQALINQSTQVNRKQPESKIIQNRYQIYYHTKDK